MTIHDDHEKFEEKAGGSPLEDREADIALEAVRRLGAIGALSPEFSQDIAAIDTAVAAATTARGRAIREATKPLEEALAAYRVVNNDTAAQLKNALELLAQRKLDCIRFEEEARAARALVREVLALVPAGNDHVAFAVRLPGEWISAARKLASIPADTFTPPADIKVGDRIRRIGHPKDTGIVREVRPGAVFARLGDYPEDDPCWFDLASVELIGGTP